MSANRSLISLGLPYFQLAQKNYAGMSADGLWGTGISYLYAEVKVLKLPPALSSPREIHPFISFQYLSGPFSWSPILELGVTPTGAPVAAYISGPTIWGGDNAIAPGSGWHTLEWYYDFGGDRFIMTVDGVGASDTGLGSATLSPNGEPMRVVLFNGAALTSRTQIAIRRAMAMATETSPIVAQRPITWAFSEFGGELANATTAAGDYPNIDFLLGAEIGSPATIPPPYGPATGDPASAMRWHVETDWTQRARPTTAWAKAGV